MDTDTKDKMKKKILEMMNKKKNTDEKELMKKKILEVKKTKAKEEKVMKDLVDDFNKVRNESFDNQPGIVDSVGGNGGGGAAGGSGS